ncbi:MAG TPA: DNA polymerase III subunit alpha, partial [Spirochaetota bacterium]|nr:DNA polymerase III subunit alpha [Spirochaetota bacterium]
MKFVHLHNHSDYSILDGSITVDRLIEKTASMGMPGVALTDHGNMFGAIEFYEKARARGVVPILGQEFYVAAGSRFSRESKAHGKDSSHHLVLLAENAEGYKNLIKLSSIGYLEGFYYKPRIDMEVLEKHSRGLIALSACLGGEIPVLIQKGQMKEAAALAGRMGELFGREHFYLELQDHGIPEQKTVNRELVRISGELNLPLVVTNDCHYAERNDAYSHEVLLCIQTGKFLDEESRMRFPSDKFYFRSPQEMQSLFAELPDALYNTVNIMEMTDVKLNLGQPILPHFQVPEGFTLDSYLKHLVYEGAKKIYGGTIPGEIVTRIEYELSVITKMQFSGYFLIVWDFINWARENSIPVGPGRGSAAGSIVAYALGITSLDPMKYNLLFERFLNPDRNEMPDMDIDFCAERREEVIQYVKRKYGEDHVSQIITFNKMKAKAVIKDVARVLRIPFNDANLISKHITSDSLSEELDTSADLKKIYRETEKGKTLIDVSLTLEGHVRSAGKHAAGVVISREPLMEYAPLYRDTKDGSISSQYEKNSLEKAGLVKMDFLGLKNLTIIDKCLKLIEKNRGEKLDIGAIPLDDAETYSLLQRGDTNGVFQLESAGMQNVLRKLGPTCFEDIIAVNALYRPGPLNSGMVDDFIKRKRNPATIQYQHPSLEPILK